MPKLNERVALLELSNLLKELKGDVTPEVIQQIVYDVGKKNPIDFPNLRDWFKALYEILLGQEQGPRMGSFIVLYGIKETIKLIEEVLEKTDG